MKLPELISIINNPQLLNKLYEEQRLNIESEALLIYMKEELNLNSEIIIFEIEETEDDLIFNKNGVKYIQLFSLDYTIELIELDLDLKDKGYSDFEIAKRLLDYRNKDA